jgi:hypothetical protein
MDKNIIKETMLSLEGAALQTRSVRMEEIFYSSACSDLLRGVVGV